MRKIKDGLEKNILILHWIGFKPILTLKGLSDGGWYEIRQSEILLAEWEKFSIKNEEKVTEKFFSKNKTANVLASKDKKKNFL